MTNTIKTYCTCGAERTFLKNNIFDAYCSECKKPTYATEFRRIMFGFGFDAYARYQEEPEFRETALGKKMTARFEAMTFEMSEEEKEELLMEKLRMEYYEDCLS